MGTPADGGTTRPWSKGASRNHQSGWCAPITSTFQYHRFSNTFSLCMFYRIGYFKALSLYWHIQPHVQFIRSFGILGITHPEKEGGHGELVMQSSPLPKKQTRIHSVHGNRAAMLLLSFGSFSMPCFFFSPCIIEMAWKFIGLNQGFSTVALLIFGLDNPLLGCRESLCPVGCLAAPLTLCRRCH